MAQELLYTSAPRGLFPGSSGFCTVQMTDGLSRPAIEFLEGLSNYYRPAPKGIVSDGPPAVSFVRGKAGASAVRVLSRNTEAPADYTGRSNNIAHHLVLDSDDLQRADNPASLALVPNLFVTRWDGSVKTLPPKATPSAPGWGREAVRWKAVAGDPGWAMAVAEAWLGGDGPLYLIYEPGVDVLPLLAEAIDQLPPGRRSDATFTTYYTGLPMGVGCVVRGVLAGTEHESTARKAKHLVLKDLAGRTPPTSARPVAAAVGAGAAEPYRMSADVVEDDDPFGPEANGPPPLSRGGAGVPPSAPRVTPRQREYEAPPPKPGPTRVLLGGLIASVLVNLGMAVMFLMGAGKQADVAEAQRIQAAAQDAQREAEAAQKKAAETQKAAETEKEKAVQDAKMSGNDAARIKNELDEANKRNTDLVGQVEAAKQAAKAEKDRADKLAEASNKKEPEKKPKDNPAPKPIPPKPGVDVAHKLIGFELGQVTFEYEKAELKTDKDAKNFTLYVPLSFEPKTEVSWSESPEVYRLDAKGGHPFTTGKPSFNIYDAKGDWVIQIELGSRKYLGEFPDKEGEKRKEDLKKRIKDAEKDAKAIFNNLVFRRKVTKAELDDKAVKAPLFYLVK